MGVIERARSTWVDLVGTAKVAAEIPKFLPQSRWNSARMLQGLAERIPNNLGIAYLDERYTWRQVNEKANQYADFFLKQGVGKGDTVAVMVDNRPDFLFIEEGLNKVRAIAAFINTNLTGKALAHAINVSNPKAALIGSEHLAALKEVEDELELSNKERTLWIQQETPEHKANGYRIINDEVDGCSRRELGHLHEPRAGERACYIYTSGTTGLPKAAIITNQRWMVAGTMFGKTMHDATPKDVIYVTLPLYHSSAQWAGWGASLTTGAAIALRRKFSASNFWNDVRDFGATRFIYIGELCRYLLNQPPQPGERDHKLKIGVGNGLRPDIWEKFQDRFGIPLIREFYGATEGNAPLTNLEGRPGMVGRMRPGQILVKCDPASGELIRNSKGLADQIGVGDKGLFLGRINPLIRFDGYADKEATQKKILRDILKKGDSYFNTGDVLQLHEDGWLSFADRVGDTFRWKGENVSTNEVAEILNGAEGVLESNVYGVEVPGSDGRCGMASINVNDHFKPEKLAKYVIEKLPNFQRPYFVRVQHDMRITGTFKHQKVDYRNEGYDPGKVSDPLYFLDEDKKTYVPIDKELFKKIKGGEIAPR